MSTEKNEYIVIQKNYTGEENSTNYLIVGCDWFKQMPLSEVYGNFGQQFGYENSNAVLELLTESAIFEANAQEEHERECDMYEIGDYIYASDNRTLFIALLKKLEAKDYILTQSNVKGYTYHDGQNFKTVTIEVDTNEPTHTRVKEELENEILAEYLNPNFEVKKDSAGYNRKAVNKYVFIESAWQGDFEIAAVTENE